MNKKRKAGNGNFLDLSLYFLLLIYFLIFFIADVEGAEICEIETNGLYSIGKDELLYMLGIKAGRPIDEESLRLGIKRAFLKGLFEDISVETTDGEKVKVIINVKERDFIKNIYIEGDYALPKKILKESFPLKEGQSMGCDIIGSALDKLRHEIAIRGFPDAGVNADIERLKEPYRINIHLRVDTGKPEIIKKINISGAGSEIKAVMKLSEGDVYNRSLLKKDLERIKEYYKSKGFFKPVIGPYTFTDGTLDISVNPGKGLQISIEGNNAVSTKALLKETPFFEEEDFSDDIVQEAVSRMSSLYHKKGFPFVQIAPVVTPGNAVISIKFFIFEGIKVRVGSIKFSGASLLEKSLKEIMSLKEGGIYNPDILDADRETLKDFYNALGYLQADVEEFRTKYDESSHKIDIAIRIQEGLRTTVSEVNIVGAKLVPEAEVRKAINIKPGDIYNDVDISDARYRIIELYSIHGLIEATISVKRDIEGQKASITFQMDEGAEILFGKTIIRGNYTTKYLVVKRELQQEEGMPFDYRILTTERQKLYKLGLFTDVEMEALDNYDHKKDVLIKLREGNAGAVELSLGYGEYERYRGILDLSYKNLWGLNRQSSLRFEMSSIERRYILQYYEPWFLGTSLPFRAFLLREEKKEISIDTRETRYRLTRHTATAGFEKKFSDTLKAEAYYEFSLVRTFDVKPDVILSREDTGTLVISGIRFGVIYDTRDNPFDPGKGILSGISLKLTSPFFLSETDFIKLIFYGNYYHELTKRVVLALSLRGGVAQGYLKTDELPIVERFFLGGRTTVRGYAQDTLGPKGVDGTPTGGNAFLMENLEIRTSLGKGIGIVAFLDGGNVWLKINDINPADFKFTTGLGLRYNTPVGPIRVDYGHKLQRKPGESRGEIHFSIGHAF